MVILPFVAGILLGGGLAWLVARLVWHTTRLPDRHAMDARLAAADSTITALRQQLHDLTGELGRIRKELDGERQQRAVAETRCTETSQHVAEQRTLLETAQQKLVDTFKALSADALRSNNQAFLQLASQSLDKVVVEVQGELGQKQEAMKGLVKPLEAALTRYQEQVQHLEQNRAQAYGELTQQIVSLGKTEERLQQEAEHLVSALRLPQVRGRWGEMTLKRVVELSGMAEHCDFVEQPSVQAEGGRLRPDLLVHLPAGRQVVVDAKTSLSAYLDAIEASNDEQHEAALREHAAQLRAHMVHLSSKAYWGQFPEAPEFVVMFIPGESFFSAALKFDRTLIEDGIANRVVLSTPTTIIALLRAIAYGWRQEQLTHNAQEIADIGRQLYSRFQTFLQHVNSLRADLEQSVYSCNKMLGSLEGRILPGLRRFKELGATGEEDLPVIEPIEQTPRHLLGQDTPVLAAAEQGHEQHGHTAERRNR